MTRPALLVLLGTVPLIAGCVSSTASARRAGTENEPRAADAADEGDEPDDRALIAAYRETSRIPGVHEGRFFIHRDKDHEYWQFYLRVNGTAFLGKKDVLREIIARGNYTVFLLEEHDPSEEEREGVIRKDGSWIVVIDRTSPKLWCEIR